RGQSESRHLRRRRPLPDGQGPGLGVRRAHPQGARRSDGSIGTAAGGGSALPQDSRVKVERAGGLDLTTPASIPALNPAARSRVRAMTMDVGVFRSNEIPVALEVFDGATGARGRRRDPDYRAAGIEQDGELVAWACWGPTPGTAATFDLYWIVVDPAH